MANRQPNPSDSRWKQAWGTYPMMMALAVAAGFAARHLLDFVF